MIYAIGLRGLVEAKFQIDGSPKAKVRTVQKVGLDWVTNEEGQLVWKDYEGAQSAARMLNGKALLQKKVSSLGEKSSWIVLGVSADWDRDTMVQSNVAFPEANQLKNPARLVELSEALMFDTRMEIQTETTEENQTENL